MPMCIGTTLLLQFFVFFCIFPFGIKNEVINLALYLFDILDITHPLCENALHLKIIRVKAQISFKKFKTFSLLEMTNINCLSN